jgi:hypothetical protein
MFNQTPPAQGNTGGRDEWYRLGDEYHKLKKKTWISELKIISNY